MVDFDCVFGVGFSRFRSFGVCVLDREFEGCHDVCVCVV